MRRTNPLAMVVICFAISGCANDKTMHFVAGAATSKYITKQTNSHMAGCAAALAVGIAKEVYDSQRSHGYVDRQDALATGAGCMLTVRF